MSRAGIESAFLEKFATLGYTYVSLPNGPKVESPATSMNYSLSVIYGDSEAAGLGAAAANRHNGYLQILVRAPLTTASGDAAGTYEVNSSVDVIEAAFKKGTSLQYPSVTPTTFVHCQVPSTRILGNLGDSWYTVAIRVPFTSDSF